MFERNRIDNSLKASEVPVELTLADGGVLKGRLIINSSRSAAEVLNGEQRFIDFETYDGERVMIAKSTIAKARFPRVVNAPSLASRIRDADAFDPHATLKVVNDAPWADVRQAYLSLSKIYHPDRFAGVTLPPEVRDYLAAMAGRINAAYDALEAPVISARTVESAKAKAVFTTPQRG